MTSENSTLGDIEVANTEAASHKLVIAFEPVAKLPIPVIRTKNLRMDGRAHDEGRVRLEVLRPAAPVSLLFTIMVSIVWLTGTSVIGWGMFATSGWLTGVGLLIWLLGCFLYARSLSGN